MAAGIGNEAGGAAGGTAGGAEAEDVSVVSLVRFLADLRLSPLFFLLKPAFRLLPQKRISAPKHPHALYNNPTHPRKLSITSGPSWFVLLRLANVCALKAVFQP